MEGDEQEEVEVWKEERGDEHSLAKVVSFNGLLRLNGTSSSWDLLRSTCTKSTARAYIVNYSV